MLDGSFLRADNVTISGNDFGVFATRDVNIKILGGEVSDSVFNGIFVTNGSTAQIITDVLDNAGTGVSVGPLTYAQIFATFSGAIPTPLSVTATSTVDADRVLTTFSRAVPGASACRSKAAAAPFKEENPDNLDLDLEYLHTAGTDIRFRWLERRDRIDQDEEDSPRLTLWMRLFGVVSCAGMILAAVLCVIGVVTVAGWVAARL